MSLFSQDEMEEMLSLDLAREKCRTNTEHLLATMLQSVLTVKVTDCITMHHGEELIDAYVRLLWHITGSKKA